MPRIHSKILGTLEQDTNFDDWWTSKPIPVPFFEGAGIPFTFMDFTPADDPTFPAEAERAIAAFLQLGAAERDRAAPLVFQNCRDFLEAIGYEEEDDALWKMEQPDEVWQFVTPDTVFVQRRHRRDRDVYLSVECACDWEHEHGLQLVFRQGRQLTRVSAYDGHLTEADAYDKPDAEDELLRQFDGEN